MNPSAGTPRTRSGERGPPWLRLLDWRPGDRAADRRRIRAADRREPHRVGQRHPSPRLGPRQLKLAREMYDSEELTVQQIANEFGVTRPTIYRHFGKTTTP
ncbi:helix-turn-helix domain-containing protein [Streptomyces sp. NBC_01643]|uniref:helix-turn-helix domain-containing protein n=1 Tax=Streptomyces sp. NBC_01643 TaxID=2975906 RepID=UPI002F90677D|nr:helix-turn-helix domain-containing protein [Streptomyces sp. NBC_01643]